MYMILVRMNTIVEEIIMMIGNLYNNMICKVIYVARGMVYYLLTV